MTPEAQLPRSSSAGWALQQFWLFWVAPMIGAALAGLTYRTVFEPDSTTPAIAGREVA